MRTTKSPLQDESSTRKQQTTELSGCDRLYQLLSKAPQKTQHTIPDNGAFSIGMSGLNALFHKEVQFNSHDQNTNAVIRALAACQMSLFVAPTGDGNTYVADETDIHSNSTKNGPTG